MLALFRTKFAYNSAFRNLVFRWELCKGLYVRECEELIKKCASKRQLAIDSRLATRKNQAHVWEHARS